MLTTKNKLILQVIAVLAVIAVIYLLAAKKSAAEKNRDEIAVVLQDITSHAQTHFRRTDLFTGWEIPGSLKNEKIGTFREKVEYNKVKIYVVGKELGENGISNVSVEATITGSASDIKIRN